MVYYPYGSLPGEEVGTHVHIKKGSWWLLRQDPGFLKNWNSPAIDRPYHIALSCLTRGLSDDEVLTVVRIWHNKHERSFDEGDFWSRTYQPAADYAAPKVNFYKANQYWAEVRRIADDSKARQHSKLRVAYYLMNTDQASAKEIHERTGISLKTVRNSLQVLQLDGKVRMASYGLYSAVRSFFWDQATVVTTDEGGYVWDDDHSATYWWDQTINEAEFDAGGYWRMSCYDYCRDRFADVVFDGDQSFIPPSPNEVEWVIDSRGEVVENGTGYKFISLFPEVGPSHIVGHRNGNKLDFRRTNLLVTGRRSGECSDEVDFFARLCA